MKKWCQNKPIFFPCAYNSIKALIKTMQQTWFFHELAQHFLGLHTSQRSSLLVYIARPFLRKGLTALYLHTSFYTVKLERSEFDSRKSCMLGNFIYKRPDKAQEMKFVRSACTSGIRRMSCSAYPAFVDLIIFTLNGNNQRTTF